MASDPAPTMIGVGLLGFGALTIYAAYKNVSPFALVRQAVTTGSLDPSNASPLTGNLGGTITGSGRELAVQAAIDSIAKKDPALAGRIKAQILFLNPNSPYSATKTFFDLMSQARQEGFTSEVDTLEAYVNSVVPTASTGTGSGPVHNV